MVKPRAVGNQPDMRGVGGILDALVNLLEAVGVDVQPWTLSAVALGLLVLLLPLIIKNLNTGSARTALKRARVLEGEDRVREEMRALDLVGEHPMGLVAVADEALRGGRKKVAREAVARLERTGKARDHLRRLRSALDPDDLPKTLDAAVLMVERLVESGLLVRAEERLAACERKFGSHPDFSALRSRLDDPPAPSASAADSID